MIVNNTSEIFKTVIPLKTRVEAEKFRRYQCQGNKAKQVYLNTLAVSAVSSYLDSMGWSTSRSDSDSWNPVLQTMMDVADLQIPSYGKLECRFVLDGEDSVTIPPEVWSERIGYVVVKLDESLQQATILGFLRRVSQIEVPLEKLECLGEFPAYLCQQKRAAPIPPVTQIGKWFDGQVDRGWQKLEDLFTPTMALNFRSPQKLANHTSNQLSSEIHRVKIVQLGKEEAIDIALVLNIQPQDNQEFNISLTVCNSQLKHFLPEGLELIISDRDSRPVMIAQANETKTIEFCFSGKLREQFSIEVSLDEQIRIESFII